MLDKLIKMQNNLDTLKVFETKHRESLTKMHAWPSTFDLTTKPAVSINAEDTALAGKVWGRDGWARNGTYGKYFNWTKVVDDVEITILHAEDFNIPEDGSPVPVKAFPLMLQEC